MFQGIFKSAINDANKNYIFGTGSIPINIKSAQLATFADGTTKQQGYQVAEVNKLISTMLTGWDANGNKPKSMSDNYLELILSCDNGFVVKKKLQFPHIIAWQNDDTPYNIVNVYEQFSIDNWLKADDFENPDITLVVEPTDEILTTSTANPPEATTTNSGKFYLYYRNLPVGVNRVHIDFHIKTKTEPIDFDLEVIDGLLWKDAQTIIASNEQAKINVLLSSVKDVYKFNGAEGNFEDITMHEWNELYQQIISLAPSNKFTHDLYFYLYEDMEVPINVKEYIQLFTGEGFNPELYVSELFIENWPEGEYLDLRKGSGQFIVAYSSSIFARINNPVSNNEVYPLTVYSSKDDNYPVGTTIGYVVFKDVDGLLALSNYFAYNNSAYQLYARKLSNFPIIQKYLYDITELQGDITELQGDIKELQGDIGGISEIIISPEQYIKRNFTDNFTSNLTTAKASVFSGFVFGVGTFESPIRYIVTKVMCATWANNTTPITKCQINFVSYTPVEEGQYIGSGRTLIWSGTITVPKINPGESDIVIFPVGKEPIQPVAIEGQNLYIEIKFDSLCALYKFKSGTDFNTLPTTYFTNGDLNKNSAGSPRSNTSFALGCYCGFSLEKDWQLTDEQIQNIGERLSTPTPETESINISLPDKLYAVVGDTLQLFYRGCIQAVNPYNYNILVSCSKGAQYPRYFQYTPIVSDIGTTTFEIKVKNNNGTILGEKSCQLITVSAGSSPSSQKNILCFGDSLTAAGTWCAEAFRRLTGSDGTPAGKAFNNITFCGSKNNAGAGYFGVGGWQWSSYTTQGRAAYRFQVTGVTNLAVGAVYVNNGISCTIMEVNITEGVGNILCSYSGNGSPQSSGILTKTSGSGDETINYTSYAADSQNPLWDYQNNKMTFIPYANLYCNGQIDIVYTLLSWNGQLPWKEDFTSIKAEIRKFADTLHSEFPNAKLKILGIQVNSINGGMGANYGATGTSYADTYGNVVTVLNQNEAYQELANETAYSSFVEFVNVSSQFDSEYNMPYSNVAVNTRSSVMEMRGTNGVHPSDAGYKQIGDIVFRNLIKEICQ